MYDNERENSTILRGHQASEIGNLKINLLLQKGEMKKIIVYSGFLFPSNYYISQELVRKMKLSVCFEENVI